jgi:O-acetylhomoserine (thiol)-lyase
MALGAETLALRMDRTSATALALAQWLEQHPAVAQGALPAAASRTRNTRAPASTSRRARGCCRLSCATPASACPCATACSLPIKATGLADTRTLIIPVAHTIFWEAGPEVRANMGIGDSMIRLSVGLEDASGPAGRF